MTCPFFLTTTCEQKCPWKINAPQYDDCFWVYVQEHSDIDGVMNPTSQTNIGELLNIKPTQIVVDIKKALKELAQLLGALNGETWLQEMETSGFETLPKITETIR